MAEDDDVGGSSLWLAYWHALRDVLVRSAAVVVLWSKSLYALLHLPVTSADPSSDESGSESSSESSSASSSESESSSSSSAPCSETESAAPKGSSSSASSKNSESWACYDSLGSGDSSWVVTETCSPESADIWLTSEPSENPESPPESTDTWVSLENSKNIVTSEEAHEVSQSDESCAALESSPGSTEGATSECSTASATPESVDTLPAYSEAAGSPRARRGASQSPESVEASDASDPSENLPECSAHSDPTTDSSVLSNSPTTMGPLGPPEALDSSDDAVSPSGYGSLEVCQLALLPLR